MGKLATLILGISLSAIFVNAQIPAYKPVLVKVQQYGAVIQIRVTIINTVLDSDPDTPDIQPTLIQEHIFGYTRLTGETLTAWKARIRTEAKDSIKNILLKLRTAPTDITNEFTNVVVE